MHRTVAAGLAVACVAGSAQAQVHYHCDDPVGAFQICRDSKGNMYTITHDAVGATITDSRGHMSRAQTDILGDTIIQNQDGSQVRSHKDPFGDTTYEDNQGHQSHCHRSPINLPGQMDEDCD
jgi:hypothetical protein